MKSWYKHYFDSYFTGGFAPCAHKVAARQKEFPPVEIIDSPDRLEIPLLQHSGPAARPLVDIGEHVHLHQLIAEVPQDVTAQNTDEQRTLWQFGRIHSPIEGIVTAIKNRTLADGQNVAFIVMEADSLPPEIQKTQPTFGSHPMLGSPCSQHSRPSQGLEGVELLKGLLAWRSAGRTELLRRIAVAGVVGLGGATFPTAAKLEAQQQCDYLLINAAESEPYLRSDEALIREMALDVIGGIDVLAAILAPQNIVICLEQSYLRSYLRAAIAKYRELLRKHCKAHEHTEWVLGPLHIATLPSRYPQGGEYQLIEAITGRKVPPGKRPFEFGCTVVNAATAKAMYDAAARELPLTHRFVSVGGGAVRKPKVFYAPLGMSLVELLERCGGLGRRAVQMIAGGPFMGSSFYDLQQFVGKGSTGFLFLDEVSRKKERPCIRCGLCVEVCPMGLEPVRLYRQLLAEAPEDAAQSGLFSCIECGACASVCPSQLSLVQTFRMGKQRLPGNLIDKQRLSIPE